MITVRIIGFSPPVGIFHARKVKNNQHMTFGGQEKMIKGVNRQVIEITLRERAGLIADSAGIPPASKLKKRKIISALKFACSALAGAAVTALISFLL